VGNLACAMLLKMSILKMSSNTEIREKGECAAARAVGQGLWSRQPTTADNSSSSSGRWRENMTPAE